MHKKYLQPFPLEPKPRSNSSMINDYSASISYLPLLLCRPQQIGRLLTGESGRRRPPAHQVAASHKQIRPPPLPERSGQRHKFAAASLQVRPPSRVWPTPATTGCYPFHRLDGNVVAVREQREGGERRGGGGLREETRPVPRDSSDLEVSAHSRYGRNIPSVGTSWFLFHLCTNHQNEASGRVRPMPF